LLATFTRAASSVRHCFKLLPGFQFDETMTGQLRLDGQPSPKQVRFRVRAAVSKLADFAHDGRTEIRGEVSIDSLVESAPLIGSLWILPLSRVIRYQFDFQLPSGETMHFGGQKDVRLLALKETMTTLPAVLQDSRGAEIGRATVYFNIRDLPSFLCSFRTVTSS